LSFGFLDGIFGNANVLNFDGVHSVIVFFSHDPLIMVAHHFTLLEGTLKPWDIGCVSFTVFSNGSGLFSVFEHRSYRVVVLH